MNDENEMRKITVGIISENEFVELFATDKQKEKYYEKNMFTSHNKDTVLKQAKRECEIEPMGKRQYEISKIYEYPVPQNFDAMNKGLYKYLIPLVLGNLLLLKIYDFDNMIFSFRKWFEMVELINSNYAAFKGNIDFSSKKIDIDKNILTKYYENTDDVLFYYFKKSLEHLKTANLFNFQEVNFVCVRKKETSTQEDGKEQIKINRVHRRATLDEMKFVRKCDQAACLVVGIPINDNNTKEKYYGSKSHSYLKHFKELLGQKDILFVYKAYEIYHTDRDIQRCYELLKAFDIKEDDGNDKLRTELVAAFKENIIINTGKRIEKKPHEYGIYDEKQAESFIEDYTRLATLTLGYVEKDKIVKGIPRTIDEDDASFIDTYIKEKMNFICGDEEVDIGVKRKYSRG